MKTTSINYAPSTESSIESARSTGQLLIGKLVGFEQNGNPKIDIEGTNDGHALEALSTVILSDSDIGKDVAVSFAQNQGGPAIVMGVIRRLIDDVLNTPEQEKNESQELKPEVLVDGNRLELSAPEEVTIRCGEASITLNKNGKIHIKGDHMLNRMSGSYKIKSGSIDLN